MPFWALFWHSFFRSTFFSVRIQGGLFYFDFFCPKKVFVFSDFFILVSVFRFIFSFHSFFRLYPGESIYYQFFSIILILHVFAERSEREKRETRIKRETQIKKTKRERTNEREKGENKSASLHVLRTIVGYLYFFPLSLALSIQKRDNHDILFSLFLFILSFLFLSLFLIYLSLVYLFFP